MAYSLKIYLSTKEIGVLTQVQDTGLLQLNYNQDWQQNGFAISPALTLNNNHPPATAYNFLDNLLPEGHARQLLAQDLGVSEKNIYPQIKSLGNDLSGAVTFCDNQPDRKQPTFRPISEIELIERLDKKEDFGLLHWDNKPRLSVAGVQDKLNILINEQDQIGFGDGSLCSTHLLKFEKANCKNLVLNEYFCMKLSKAVGLPTADVSIKRYGRHPTLIVTRFDRKLDVKSQHVMRRHVIDGCQALNLPREFKYERNFGDNRDVQHIRDGASLAKLFNFCQQTTSPVQSMQWLINWQLFNLMINNYDSHGKNLSFYYDKNTCQFTPAYDLVNVAMFEQFNHVLAMAMGDEFEPKDIHAYQLADFAETCQLNKKLVSRMLTQLAQAVLKQLAANNIVTTLHHEMSLDNQEIDYLTKLSKNIEQRTRHLLAQTQDMLTIEV